MILGAVLAGGRSRRFGSDKALAPWRGRPLIDHVIERLGTVCRQVIVCGREHGGIVAIPDRPVPDLGPLAGLNAALHFAVEHGFARVLSAPCDAPLLSDALLAALCAGDDSAFLAAQPVIGCWRADLAPLLDRHVREDQRRSMRGWVGLAGARGIDLPGPLNVNRPEDLEALDER